MLGPTEAIRENAVNLFRIVFVLVLVLGVACVAIWQVNTNAFHEALGTYGVKIDAAQGQDVNGMLGTWWPGYAIVESAAQNVSLPLGLLIGFSLGLIPLALMGSYVANAIRRIKELEKQIHE